MKHTFIFSSSIFALLVSLNLLAYGVDDPGATSCGLFTEMYEAGGRGTRRQFYSWTQGYLYAQRKSETQADDTTNTGQETTDLSPDDQFQFLLTFCGNNPETVFQQAVEALWHAMHQDR
jgi:hypothetical protein